MNTVLVAVSSTVGLSLHRGSEKKGRKIYFVGGHRDDGRRFIVRSDELLSAFLELQRQVKDQVEVASPIE